MLPVRTASAILFALLAAGASGLASAATFTRHTASVEYAGSEGAVDIYRPGDGVSAGVAVIAHGFARSRIRHRDLGQALAKAGVTAVIPDLPNVMDLWGNGDAIVELVDRLQAGAFGEFPADRSRLVLIGTSAGGLASVLAAVKLPGLAGWIGLDPVDRSGSGSVAAAQLDAPAVVLLGGASSCNLFGSGRDIARALPHLVRTLALKDASHCDFEDPTTNLCRVLCGRSSAQMQARIRDETVRATIELLGIAAARDAPLSPADEEKPQPEPCTEACGSTVPPGPATDPASF